MPTICKARYSHIAIHAVRKRQCIPTAFSTGIPHTIDTHNRQHTSASARPSAESSAWTLVGSVYGDSKRPAANFDVSTFRAARSMDAMLVLFVCTAVTSWANVVPSNHIEKGGRRFKTTNRIHLRIQCAFVFGTSLKSQVWNVGQPCLLSRAACCTITGWLTPQDRSFH